MNSLTTRFSGDVGAEAHTARSLRLLAIGAALVVNLIILIAGRLATGDLPVATMQGDDQTIGYAQVIIVTLLAGLAAWGLLALLERVTSRPVAIWTTIAVAFVILSLLGPISGGVDTESKVILAALHIGAAVTIIPLMRRSAAQRS